MYLPDSDGKPSITATAFIVGFLVCTTKLLISGITVLGFSMSAFSGSDYATAVGALGAVYVLRRHSSITQGGDDKSE